MRILNDNNEEFPIEYGKYLVPLDKELDCIRNHYDGPQNGHPGVARTTERIRRNYTFLQIRQKVSDYIKKCDSCCKNKSSRHAKYSNLQFRPPPDNP